MEHSDKLNLARQIVRRDNIDMDMIWYDDVLRDLNFNDKLEVVETVGDMLEFGAGNYGSGETVTVPLAEYNALVQSKKCNCEGCGCQ